MLSRLFSGGSENGPGERIKANTEQKEEHDEIAIDLSRLYIASLGLVNFIGLGLRDGRY
jgi:hypothetical protein